MRSAASGGRHRAAQYGADRADGTARQYSADKADDAVRQYADKEDNTVRQYGADRADRRKRRDLRAAGRVITNQSGEVRNMGLIVSFLIFILAMIGCLITGHTMVIALGIGLVCFAVTGMRRGFGFSEIVSMCRAGLKDAVIVVIVMAIIGLVTGVWRSSGTISFFVYYGMEVITPNLFLIITFLLCCIMSYALGTSFGVAGTVGVIFMALARSGGVNEALTAGVIMSGVYFGDRNSPVASSAVVVAGVTHTDMLKNVRIMLKTVAPALLITFIIYCVFSFNNPISRVDDSFKEVLTGEFSISPWCALPAALIIILPLLKVSVINSLIASIIAGIGVSLLVQREAAGDVFLAMIRGYETGGELGEIMNGGGLISMIEVVVIVGISCMYSGIFSGTEMLKPLQHMASAVSSKTGRFFVMTLTSLLTLCVFCNQTIATIMCSDLLKKTYEEEGASKTELAIDMENSVIILAPFVPWTIACTVPLEFMQADITAIPYAFLLYLTPLCYGILKKFYLKSLK